MLLFCSTWTSHSTKYLQRNRYASKNKFCLEGSEEKMEGFRFRWGGWGGADGNAATGRDSPLYIFHPAHPALHCNWNVCFSDLALLSRLQNTHHSNISPFTTAAYFVQVFFSTPGCILSPWLNSWASVMASPSSVTNRVEVALCCENMLNMLHCVHSHSKLHWISWVINFCPCLG